MIDIVLYVAGGMLAVAALLLLYRVIVGPSLVDRVIASDVMLTTLIIVIGTEMAINGHTRTIPLMVVLAVIGIFGSVSVARFVTRPTAESEAADAAAEAEAAAAEGVAAKAVAAEGAAIDVAAADGTAIDGGPR